MKIFLIYWICGTVIGLLLCRMRENRKEFPIYMECSNSALPCNWRYKDGSCGNSGFCRWKT